MLFFGSDIVVEKISRQSLFKSFVVSSAVKRFWFDHFALPTYRIYRHFPVSSMTFPSTTTGARIQWDMSLTSSVAATGRSASNDKVSRSCWPKIVKVFSLVPVRAAESKKVRPVSCRFSVSSPESPPKWFASSLGMLTLANVKWRMLVLVTSESSRDRGKGLEVVTSMMVKLTSAVMAGRGLIFIWSPMVKWNRSSSVVFSGIPGIVVLPSGHWPPSQMTAFALVPALQTVWDATPWTTKRAAIRERIVRSMFESVLVKLENSRRRWLQTLTVESPYLESHIFIPCSERNPSLICADIVNGWLDNDGWTRLLPDLLFEHNAALAELRRNYEITLYLWSLHCAWRIFYQSATKSASISQYTACTKTIEGSTVSCVRGSGHIGRETSWWYGILTLIGFIDSFSRNVYSWDLPRNNVYHTGL